MACCGDIYSFAGRSFGLDAAEDGNRTANANRQCRTILRLRCYLARQPRNRAACCRGSTRECVSSAKPDPECAVLLGTIASASSTRTKSAQHSSAKARRDGGGGNSEHQWHCGIATCGNRDRPGQATPGAHSGPALRRDGGSSGRNWHCSGSHPCHTKQATGRSLNAAMFVLSS